MERAGAWSRMRRNSKMGVTQAEAGGRPVDSKWVLPNDPSTWKNEASRRHDPGRPPSLPFLGVPLSHFLSPLLCKCWMSSDLAHFGDSQVVIQSTFSHLRHAYDRLPSWP